VSIDPVERINLTLSAGAVAASLVFATPAFAGSLAIGALLEACNFRSLRRAARFLFAGEIRGGGAWTGVYALRFGLMMIGIVGALVFGAHPVALLIGLSLIMPAAVLEACRNRPSVDSDAPSLAPEDPEWDRWDAWRVRELDPDAEAAE